MQPTDVRCISCGYDLSGTPIGGNCPECGTPVAQTLASHIGPKAPHPSAAIVLTLGIVGLVCCGGVLSPVAWFMGHSGLEEAKTTRYSPGSVAMLKAGMILGIVGTAVLVFNIVVSVIDAL